MTACTIDPLLRSLALAHETSEAGYSVGLMRLSYQQERHIEALKQEQNKLQTQRTQQTTLSTWQKITNFVSCIFIAIGLVAGVCAGAAGSGVVAVALITASLWRIGSEVVRALSLKQKILDAIVPQEVANRAKICRVLEVAAQVFDLGSHITIIALSGYVGANILASSAKNVFQLASLAATAAQTGVSGVLSVKQAQSSYTQADVTEHQARTAKFKREADLLREDLEQQAIRLEQISKSSRLDLEADYSAKQAFFSE